MKNILLILVLVAVLALGYMNRSQIKAMLMGESPTPSMAVTAANPTSTMSAPTSDNIFMVKTDPKKGQYLTDFAGMTLYTFDKDVKDLSDCYQNCALAWPPYTSGATAQKTFPKNISVFARTDNSNQFEYNGKPLYYYAKDAKAGDMTGDGVGQVWHIVKP